MFWILLGHTPLTAMNLQGTSGREVMPVTHQFYRSRTFPSTPVAFRITCINVDSASRLILFFVKEIYFLFFLYEFISLSQFLHNVFTVIYCSLFQLYC